MLMKLGAKKPCWEARERKTSYIPDLHLMMSLNSSLAPPSVISLDDAMLVI